MKIRKIEVKEESLILIEEISKYHNLTPKLWIKNYRLDQNDVLDTIEKLNKTDKNKLYLSVLENNDSLVGFIWAEKNKNNSIVII